MTYYGRTAGEHVDLHLALIIDGIPYAFVNRTVPGSPSAIGTRTQLAVVRAVEEGEASIDWSQRREVAATLDVDMLDDAAGVLRGLFALASRPVTWASIDALATDTAIEVASTATLTAGDAIYVGAETIIVGTVFSATELTGCTRGAFGSTASALYGTPVDGDSVYAVPPSWAGRRAKLYAYAPDGAGHYTETLLGTYLVDESPTLSGQRWMLRLAGVVQEYFERSVGVGLRKAAITSIDRLNDTTVALLTDDLDGFRMAVDFPTYVLVEGDTTSVYEVGSETLGALYINDDPAFGTDALRGQWRAAQTVQPLGVVSGNSPAVLLYVLLSSEGQGATAYDRLPGRPASSTHDVGWRLGAGFVGAEVDTTSFLRVSCPTMAIVIDDERKVTDILREWCLLTGTVIVATADGKIKPVTLAYQRLANQRTIGASDVVASVRPSITCDENDITPLGTVTAGYSPVTGETVDTVNLLDVALAKRYPRIQRRRDEEIRSIGIGTARPSGGWEHPARVSVGEFVVLAADLLRADGGSPRRLVSLSLTHEHLDLRLGDQVTIGADLPDGFALPDMRGGTIVGKTCRIVSRRPRYMEGRVDVVLEVMERLLHVCPAAVITAYDAGTKTFTLSTTTPEVPESGFPANSFWIGASIKMVDRSSLSGVPAVEFATVTATPSTTQITVNTGPSFVPQANVDYVVLDPDTSADGTSSDGYALVEHAMVADDTGVAGTNASADTEPRWR